MNFFVIIIVSIILWCTANGIVFDHEELYDRELWLKLSEDLHIYDLEYLKQHNIIDITLENRTVVRESMIEEGYLKLDQLFDVHLVNKMKTLIDKLDEMSIPLAFCFIYDEFWIIFMKLHRVIGCILGDDYYRLPDFWSWKINKEHSDEGWSLHRDWGSPTVDSSNGPETVTLWIPLNDVDCTNSCIYIIPANLDPTYQNFENIKDKRYWPKMLQNIRALPVKAGGVIIWNQAVWHWGSKTSSKALESRISIALAFQKHRTKAHNTPLSNPLLLLPFEERIALISKQILQYQHMYSLDSDLKMLANQIKLKESKKLDIYEFQQGIKFH